MSSIDLLANNEQSPNSFWWFLVALGILLLPSFMIQTKFFPRGQIKVNLPWGNQGKFGLLRFQRTQFTL